MPARLWIAAALAAALGLMLALATASTAGSPARASAEAAIVAGSGGGLGAIRVSGDGRRSSGSESASGPGYAIAGGQASVSASRSGARGRARASASARSVRLLDGAVTADSVSRSFEAAGGSSSGGGSVQGLTVNGRSIGTVASAATYSLADRGTVTVLSGDAGLRVALTRDYRGFSAGTVIVVGKAGASAADGVRSPARTQPRSTTPRRPARPGPRPKARKPARPGRPRSSRGGERSRPGGGARARRGGGSSSAAPKRRPAPKKVKPRLTGQRFAFPVYGKVTFSDDFGGARQIGPHQGNDIFADAGAPVLAVHDGVIEKVGTLPISGNRLWLRTDGGDTFFYAHLASFSPAAVNDRRVKAGEVLGFLGSTGDAKTTPPHLHFEVHPGDGEAVNPYPFLLAWQGKDDVPPGAWLTRHGRDTETRPGVLQEVRDFIASG